MSNKNDLYNKFRSCKWSDGMNCMQPHTSILGKLYDRIFGIPYHDVGVNGYSIKLHCENCKRYERGEQ